MITKDFEYWYPNRYPSDNLYKEYQDGLIDIANNIFNKVYIIRKDLYWMFYVIYSDDDKAHRPSSKFLIKLKEEIIVFTKNFNIKYDLDCKYFECYVLLRTSKWLKLQLEAKAKIF